MKPKFYIVSETVSGSPRYWQSSPRKKAEYKDWGTKEDATLFDYEELDLVYKEYWKSWGKNIYDVPGIKIEVTRIMEEADYQYIPLKRQIEI